jgi:hypothetical protein
MVIMPLQRKQKPAMAILVTIRQDYVFSVKFGRPFLTAGGQFFFNHRFRSIFGCFGGVFFNFLLTANECLP